MNLVVVTPTLGRSPWLAETVASVSACAPGATHVLVGPAAVAGELVSRHSNTRFVAEPPGGGMYSAINAAAAAIPAWSAITYLNDDDLLLPGFAAIMARLSSRESPGPPFMAYGRVRLIDARGRRLGAIPVSRFPPMNRQLYAERLEPVYQHGTVLSRTAWEMLGGFDPVFRLCGDSELLARACVSGIQTEFVRATIAAFRLRAGQLSKHRERMRTERAAVDAKLGLLPSRMDAGHHWTRIVFRLSNLAVYAERLARFGFKRFNDVIEAE